MAPTGFAKIKLRRSQAPAKNAMKKHARPIEDRIGYRFRNPAHLDEALTHRSRVQETPEGPACNERYEFLGDSVLGFVVSEHLTLGYPSYSEGQLSKLRAYLVSGAYLVKVARRLGLGEALYLGRGEERTGGRDKKTLLVDGLEALIAAIYLDGGLEPAKEFIRALVLTPEALGEAIGNLSLDNFKSALQEQLQGRQLPVPEYTVVSESGPPHNRRFLVQLRAGDLYTTQAEGSTKKAAEQEAARLALAGLPAPKSKPPSADSETP